MAPEAELAQVEELIRRAGVEDLARVDPADVVTAEWVRMKCRFGCGGYGRCLTCPPYSPAPRQTRRMLDEYRTAYLLWWASRHPAREALAALERGAFLLGYYRAFAMAMGPCGLCDPCPLEHPCRHPYEARPAMEACGIDVYDTAHRAGFPLEVVTCLEDSANYYSLLLIE
jgi:predicted metal-binding protein